MLDLETGRMDGHDPDLIRELIETIESTPGLYIDRASKGWVYAPADKASQVVRCSDPEVEPAQLGSMLCSARLLAVTVPSRGGMVPAPLSQVGPYLKWIGTTLAARHVKLPLVAGMYNLPTVTHEQGRMYVAPPGYDRQSGIVFVGRFAPTDVYENYPHLRTLFSDIQFSTEAYRANLLAYTVASFARHQFDQFPFLLLDAKTRSVGKSTVASAISVLLTGKPAMPITSTGDEGELEKRVATYCGQIAPCPLFLDNIRPKRGQSGAVRSQFLAVAATSPHPAVRGVYKKTAEPVDYPVVILTMNGGSVETDLADRVLRIVLTGDSGRYFNPNPATYAREHRAEIVSEILHVLTQIDVRPVEGGNVTRFGHWENVATAVAQHMHLETELNPDRLDTADTDVLELIQVAEDMHETGGIWPCFTEIAGRVQSCPAALPELNAKTKGSRATTDRARGRAILAWVQRQLHRKLFIDGRSVELVIKQEHGKRASTLEIRRQT